MASALRLPNEGRVGEKEGSVGSGVEREPKPHLTADAL